MPLVISGKLSLPVTGRPAANAEIRFRAVNSVGEIIQGAESLDRCDASGNYNISLEFARYELATKISTVDFIVHGQVTIDIDTIAEDLEGLIEQIGLAGELTDELIKEFQQLKAEAVTAANEAKQSASSAAAEAKIASDAQAAITPMYNYFNANYPTFETSYQDFSIKYPDVVQKHAEVVTLEGKAQAAKDLAEKWASNPENVPVTGSEYSAFHWAEKAKQNANQTFVSGGLFTPATGNEYPDVSGISRDTIWIMEFSSHGETYTFTSGQLSGKATGNGDMLLYDTPNNTWSLIPTAVAAGVISVDGDTGPSVNLESKYYWSGNKPAVADVTGLDSEIRSRTGIYKVGDISAYVGQSLPESEKLNSYQYPDDSDNWYGPSQSQTFPITIPADPTASGSGWSLVNGLTSDSLPLYTDIVYKASGGNSAVENMIAGIPLTAKLGSYLRTGVTLWERVSTLHSDIRDFKALNHVSVTDCGAKPDLITFSDSYFQLAYNAAGNSGVPVYIPGVENGKGYLLELKSSISITDSSGDTISNFKCYGDGRSSLLVYDINADPNFKSPFSLNTTRPVDGLEISDLSVDFNKSRTRPTPSSRLHNPLVQCVGGGKNVYLHDIYMKNANVDQPIRLAHLDVGNVYIENIKIRNVQFDTFHDGLPGADQLDISCFYIYGISVNITDCYFNSRISNIDLKSSKGITAIEFYGKDFLISNNHYEKVNRAHIVGNLDSPGATDGIVISDGIYKDVICQVDGVAVNNNASGHLVFQGNTIVNTNMGTALSLPALLFLSIPTGVTVGPWSSVEVLSNNFDYYGTGSNSTGSYSSLFGGGNMPYFRFDGNSVNCAPTGVINFYVDDATESDVDIFITNNKFRSIGTKEQQAGYGRPFAFNSIGSKTFRNWIMDNNMFENIDEKSARGGTGGSGPIVYMNISTTGKNFSFCNNGILGANLPVRTDGDWINPSNEVIQNNYNLSDTD